MTTQSPSPSARTPAGYPRARRGGQAVAEPQGVTTRLPLPNQPETTMEGIPLPVKSLDREYLTLNLSESNTLPAKKPSGRQGTLPYNSHVLNSLKGKTGKGGGGGVPLPYSLRPTPLTSPMQLHRPLQRMLALTRQPPLLQREVPLRRHVRVVDQHQPRVRPQPARLLHHRLLVLRHELRPKVRRNRRNQRHPIRNIPPRHHINPARGGCHRSHRRQRSKPPLASLRIHRPNRLIPPIRQHEINRRYRLTQQLVRRTIRRRSMRRHSKPIGDRFKPLRLLVDTRRAPPPPRPMHKRSMRRIHQPDNPVVHIARQLRLQMRTAKPLPKLRQLRNPRQPAEILHPSSPRSRHIHPSVSIALDHRKHVRIDLRRHQMIEAGQRRNLFAPPAARLKPPAMILALHRLSIEPTRRQRNPSMRTQIPHRKQRSIALPPHQHRNPQQHRHRRIAALQSLRTQRRIPIPKHHLRRRPATSQLHQALLDRRLHWPHLCHRSQCT